jgi:hypothetical protein
MRTFGIVTAALAALASTVAAAPSTSNAGTTFPLLAREDVPTDNCDAAEIPCEFLTAPIPDESVEKRSEYMSNGERLARGLPLNSPHKRTATRAHAARHSQGPTTTLRGYIRVDRADGDGELGYLSRHPFSGAQHRYQDITNAMVVNFVIPSGASSEVKQIDIQTENSDIQTTYPRLAIVQGRDNTDSDFRTGSYQYGYIAGSDATSPGATPQNVDNSYSEATGTARTAESAVWTFDPTDNSIVPVWTNTDGSAAPIQVFTQSTALYVGGDSGSFVSRYPSPIITVTYTFVPL